MSQLKQQSHNSKNSVTTQKTVSQLKKQCHNSKNSVTTQTRVSQLKQQCHNSNNSVTTQTTVSQLKQQCHNSKCMIFQERILKVLKCYNFLRVQQRHNCSPAASFANCVMTLYLLKVHLQNVSFYTNYSKMPNFELWHTLVANERYCIIQRDA